MATGGAPGPAPPRQAQAGGPGPILGGLEGDTRTSDLPWFEPEVEPLTRVDPPSGLLRRCQSGEPPPEPRSDWAPPEAPPGSRHRRTPLWGPPQRLRLLNTMTGQAHVIQVGGVIPGTPLQQALPWNAHAGGYAWRCGGEPLHPDTLLDPLNPLDPDPDDPPPTVLLYFADDFVEI